MMFEIGDALKVPCFSEDVLQRPIVKRGEIVWVGRTTYRVRDATGHESLVMQHMAQPWPDEIEEEREETA